MRHGLAGFECLADVALVHHIMAVNQFEHVLQRRVAEPRMEADAVEVGVGHLLNNGDGLGALALEFGDQSFGWMVCVPKGFDFFGIEGVDVEISGHAGSAVRQILVVEGEGSFCGV